MGPRPINSIFRRTADLLHPVRSLHSEAPGNARSPGHQHHTTVKIPFLLTTVTAAFAFRI